MKQFNQIIIFAFITILPATVFCQRDTIKQTESELIIFDGHPIPEYPGGFEALLKFVKSRAVLPKEFDTCNIAEKVFIKFIVDTVGSIINPKVLRGINPRLDSVALNIVTSMPKWIPATQNGKPVTSEFMLPIKFSFEKKEKKKK